MRSFIREWRWQVACGVLLLALVITWGREALATSGSDEASGRTARARRAAAMLLARGPSGASTDPDDAAELEGDLLDALAEADDPRVAVRLVAKLARVGTDRSVPVLAALVDDPRARLAAEAASALAAIGSDGATRALVDALRSRRSEVRAAALAGLARSDAPEAFDAIATVARERGDDDRALAIRLLGSTGDARAIPVYRGILASAPRELAADVVEGAAAAATPEARAYLREIARSRDPRTSGLASVAIAAADEDDGRRTSALVELLAAPDPEVASASASALAETGATSAVAILGRHARSADVPRRMAAIEALVDFGSPEAIAEVVEILRGGDGRSLHFAAQALASSGDEDGLAALEELARGRGVLAQASRRALFGEGGPAADRTALALRDGPSVNERIEALAYLVRSRHESAFESVRRALAGPGSERAAATSLLADLHTPEAAALLLEATRSPVGAVRERAFWALPGFVPEVPGVAEELRRTLERGTRADALAVLAGIVQASSSAARPLLLAGLRSDDAQVVGRAASCFAGYGSLSPEEEAALVEVARGGSVAARHAATQALVASDSAVGFALVDEVIAGRDDEVDLETVVAQLGSNGSPAAAEALRRATFADDPVVRRTAAYALAERSDPDSDERLVTLLDDPSPSVRAAAVAGVDSSGAEDRLRELVADPEPEVSAAALRRLVYSDVADAEALVLAALRSDDPRVVVNAMWLCANLASPDVAAALAALVEDVSRPVAMRAAAAIALRSVGGPTAERLSATVDALEAHYDEMYGAFEEDPELEEIPLH